MLFGTGGIDVKNDLRDTENGRARNRRRRLLRELREGRRRGRPLKALDVLGHATALLELGETLDSLQRLRPKLPVARAIDAQALEVIREAQALYGFREEAWRLLGVDAGRIGRGV